MRETSQDYFTDTDVICNLNNFQYNGGGSHTVYLRRSGRCLDGKRVNLTAVVALRKCHIDKPELFVSTTLRFCRAVKHCCVKGSGELVNCWNDTLKELERPSFLTGTDMYQEIHRPALTAFVKRVNPNSWCNYIPKHVESMIVDPAMVEVVELGIKFMDSKIPNGFAVAELLYCPIEKVEECVQFWTTYASDNDMHTAVTRKHIGMVEEQIKNKWANLVKLASTYGQKKQGEMWNSGAYDVFKQYTVDSVTQSSQGMVQPGQK